MDIATIIGILASFALVTGAIVSGGGASAFIHFPSMLITVGGAMFATLMSFDLKDMLGIGKVLKNAFLNASEPIEDIVKTMVKFAFTARREGVLALEKELKTVENEFIKKGVQLVVDGTEEDLTRSILETEMEYISHRHSMGVQLFEKLAEFGPAFGMIGTLVGLIQMLRSLDDPSALGPGMATALITTFYGAVMANMVCIPLASKLKNLSKREEIEKLLVLEGVAAIQAGDNPRLVEEKLLSFIPKSQRTPADGEKAA